MYETMSVSTRTRLVSLKSCGTHLIAQPQLLTFYVKCYWLRKFLKNLTSKGGSCLACTQNSRLMEGNPGLCVNHIFFVQRVKNHAKLIHSWKGGSFLAKPKFPDMRGLWLGPCKDVKIGVIVWFSCCLAELHNITISTKQC